MGNPKPGGKRSETLVIIVLWKDQHAFVTIFVYLFFISFGIHGHSQYIGVSINK